MTSKPLLVVAAVIPLLAGCALSPDYERPAIDTAEAWQAESVAGAPQVTGEWWQRFGSVELNSLIEQAMSANHDVAAALARIEQARASTRISRADRLPTVQAGLSASARDGSDIERSEDGEASLSIGYEVDLWGGRAAAATAAEAQLAASVFDLDAVRLVLQSELARQYFQALALKDRLRIAGDNLAAARKLTELVRARYENGAASALELAQQRTNVHNIEASMPALEQQLRQTQHAIAVLIGRAPQGFVVAGDALAELTLPAVDPGQPVDLLERRPDVRRAEARLIAANADIGAARAALYPGLRLSASGTVSGLISGGSTTVTSLVASLTQTLFDGGRLRGQVALSEARRNELVASYAQTVLTGFREVEDSLVAVEAQQRRTGALRSAAEQAEAALQLATVRYEAGAEDLLNLLDSQRSRLSAQDSLVQAKLAQYTATTDLYKALGGGWVSPAAGAPDRQ